jgi:hypothetical protein
MIVRRAIDRAHATPVVCGFTVGCGQAAAATLRQRVPIKRIRGTHASGGQGRNRTTDTRIFRTTKEEAKMMHPYLSTT